MSRHLQVQIGCPLAKQQMTERGPWVPLFVLFSPFKWIFLCLCFKRNAQKYFFDCFESRRDASPGRTVPDIPSSPSMPSSAVLLCSVLSETPCFKFDKSCKVCLETHVLENDLWNGIYRWSGALNYNQIVICCIYSLVFYVDAVT